MREKALTLDDLEQVWRLSRGRTRQIEGAALEKIRLAVHQVQRAKVGPGRIVR